MGELQKGGQETPPCPSYLTNAPDCLIPVNHLIEIQQQVRDRRDGCLIASTTTIVVWRPNGSELRVCAGDWNRLFQYRGVL
jgi:hypothetical protein